MKQIKTVSYAITFSSLCNLCVYLKKSLLIELHKLCIKFKETVIFCTKRKLFLIIVNRKMDKFKPRAINNTRII